jgi:hypothetical protein
MLKTDEIIELFEYKDGNLYWKKSLNNRAKIGQIAGSKLPLGYRIIGVNGKHYLMHRLIFMLFNNYVPKKIDHIDGNPLNNRIENLREANDAENSYNAKLRKDNTTGHKGVIWHKLAKKWRVIVKANKKVIYSGYFDNLELASLVAQEARHKFHGKFAKHI